MRINGGLDLLIFTLMACLQVQSQQVANSTSNSTIKCNVLNCYKCLQDNVCSDCASYFKLGNGTCQSCPDGTFFDYKKKICSPCFANCLICSGPAPADCQSCVPGFSQQIHSPTLKVIVGSAFCEYCDDSNCLICPEYRNCKECKAGYGFSSVTSRCQLCTVTGCQTCDTNLNSCDRCLNSYIQYTSIDQNSTQCMTPSDCSDTNDGNVTHVIKQYMNDTGTCQKCPATCMNCASSSQCLDCAVGYFFSIYDQISTDKGICLKCQPQCVGCMFVDRNCISCPPGKYLLYGDCIQQCPSGSFPDKTQTCVPCSSFCAQCINKDQCTRCYEPLFFALKNGTCQRLCPDGKYEYYQDLVNFTLTEGKKIFNNQSKNTLLQVEYATYLNLLQIQTSLALPVGNMTCQVCDASCLTCGSLSTLCNTCKPGKIYNNRNITCVDTCDSDQFVIQDENNQRGCDECDHPCIQCTYNSCEKCLEPYILTAGTCVFNGGYLSQNGQCPSGLFLVENLCLTKCPVGMVTDLVLGKCQCDPSCLDCLYNPVDSSVQCMVCRQADYSIVGFACQQFCPANTFAVPLLLDTQDELFLYLPQYQMNSEEGGEELDGEEDAEQLGQSGDYGQNGLTGPTQATQWICKSQCPPKTYIAIDQAFEFYCVQRCPPRDHLINGVCVPQICGRGMYQNWTLIAQDLQKYFPITAANMVQVTAFAGTLKSQVCSPCSVNCNSCQDTSFCDQCSRETFVNDDGSCGLSCDPWEYLQAVGNQILCVQCKDNCVTCPSDSILFNRNCINECPTGYEIVDGRCQIDFTTLLWFQGYGALTYMSSQKEIDLKWQFSSQTYTNISVNSIECLVSIKNQNAQDRQQTVHFIQKQVILDYDSSLYYTFQPNTFLPGSNIQVYCSSNVTVLNSTKGAQKVYIQQSNATLKTLGLPVGEFKLTPLGKNSIFIDLVSFTPFLGMSKLDFQKRLNDSTVDTNEYIIPEEYQQQRYLPFQYTLSADYEDELIEIWTYESNSEIKHYQDAIDLDEFSNSTKLTFQLKVGNIWSSTYFNTSLIVTVNDAFNALTSLKQTIASLKLAQSTAEKEQGLKIIMIYAKSLNTPPLASCICFNGYCQNQVCICDAEFVGTQCELDQKEIISLVKEAFSTIKRLLKGEKSQQILSYISSIMVDLSGINSLADQTLVAEQYVILSTLNANYELLDVHSAKNLIKIYQNTEDQISVIYISADGRRILSRAQPRINAQVSNDDSSPSSQTSQKSDFDDIMYALLTVGQYEQFILDKLFQKILITNHKIMLNSKILFQQIKHRNLTIVMTVLNMTENIETQSVNLNDIRLDITTSAVKSQLTHKNYDQPAVFLVRRALESYKDFGDFNITNSQYVQVNISQPETYQSMFTKTTATTFNNKTPLSIFFPGFSTDPCNCLYFDLGNVSWVNTTMDCVASNTHSQCNTYHLTDFAIGTYYDESKYDEMEGDAYAMEMNRQTGALNIIIVLLVYIVLSIFVCLFRRGKASPQKPNQKDDFAVVSQHDNVVDEKQIPVMIAPIESMQQDITPGLKEQVSSQDIDQLRRQPANTASSSPLKEKRLYNFIFCLCPYPQTYIPSMHRLSVIFLWFTCSQFIFAVLETSNFTQDALIGVLFVTIVVSNIFNYIYAGIAQCLTKIAPAHKFTLVKLLINLVIFIHLMIVYALYANNKSIYLQEDHLFNLVCQILINMGLFDFFMELISKYPGIGFLRRMRSFKLIEYVDE